MKYYKPQIRETPRGLAIDLSVRLSFEELSAILTADQIRELLLGLAKVANVEADPLPDGEPIPDTPNENEKRGL